MEKKTKATLAIVALAVVFIYLLAPSSFFQLNSAVNLSSTTVNVSITYADRECDSIAGAFCSTALAKNALPELAKCPSIDSQCFVCEQGFEYNVQTNSCLTYAQQSNVPKPAASTGYVTTGLQSNPTAPYTTGQAASTTPPAEDTPSYIWLIVGAAAVIVLFVAKRKS